VSGSSERLTLFPFAIFGTAYLLGIGGRP
jgi:hypothetical protein